MPGLKLPKTKPPNRIEKDYQKSLLRLVNFMAAQFKERIMPLLEPMVALGTSDLPPGGRADSIRIDNREEIDLLFQRIEQAIDREFPQAWAESVSASAAADVDRFNTAKNEKTFRKLIGVKPVLAEPWLEQKAKAFISDNVDLITSMRREYLRNVKGSVTRAVDKGVLNRTFARQIESAWGSELERVTSNVRARARLIARDQIAKLNGQINQARQQSIGFTHYRWVTSGDERVRESHRRNNGKVFAWADPPETGHPGDDFQCRCYAEPLITEEFEGDRSLALTFNSRQANFGRR